MQENNEQAYIFNDKFPMELNLYVFSFFRPIDLAKTTAQVSKSWNFISNDNSLWSRLMRNENVVFNPNNSAKASFKKLQNLKRSEYGKLIDIHQVDIETVRMIFSDRDLFAKLTSGQINLLIYTFGWQVLEVAYSLTAIVTALTKPSMMAHAENNKETAQFIMQHKEIWHLLNGDDLVKIAIHPEVGNTILATPQLNEKLIPVQQEEIRDKINLLSDSIGHLVLG